MVGGLGLGYDSRFLHHRPQFVGPEEGPQRVERLRLVVDEHTRRVVDGSVRGVADDAIRTLQLVGRVVSSQPGVEVLNINELANALKPVVLPGEFMKVFILKEGKEYNQGVAYLDDGTMVVVDNARQLIGKTIDVVVTSVLQTTAGKMIFGRYIEAGGAVQTPAVEKDEPVKRARA